VFGSEPSEVLTTAVSNDEMLGVVRRLVGD
jgi:hypothetical protein